MEVAGRHTAADPIDVDPVGPDPVFGAVAEPSVDYAAPETTELLVVQRLPGGGTATGLVQIRIGPDDRCVLEVRRLDLDVPQARLSRGVDTPADAMRWLLEQLTPAGGVVSGLLALGLMVAAAS